MMKRLIILICFLLYINSFGQQYSKSWKNINYAGDTLKYHLLDIYLPAEKKTTYPVVIVIYGSAWYSNNLKGSVLSNLGNPLLNAGFAVVSPNHRSSFDAKFPAQINDIKAVIRFIRANADMYQIDTSFIGITGFSSGGHLAAMAGTSRFVKQYTVGSVTEDIEGNVGPFTSYSSSVDAVVDWFGPVDLQTLDSCRTQKLWSDSTSPEAALVGGPVSKNIDKIKLASPITYIDETDPPFLILHGDKDPLVPYCQSTKFYKALQDAKVPSQLVLVPNAQHGPGMFEKIYLKMMTDFFKQRLDKR
jgi:acetyl esterase/lipase